METKFYELLADERRERIEAINSIHARLDELFNAVNRIGRGPKAGGENASWVRQSIGITLGVIALLGVLIPTIGMIVRPVSQNIEFIKNDFTKFEDRFVRQYAEEMQRLDEKLQIEISKLDKATGLESERTKARIGKLERVANQHIEAHFPKLEVLCEKVKVIERDLRDLKVDHK